MSAEEIFERFEIEFDAGQEPVFHGSELVTGSLKVNLKKRITINAIRLQFKGRSCWLLDTHKNHETKEKVYFDKDFVLLERPPGHPEPGHFSWNPNFTYSLPFECPLPKGCPTSYESPHAFIRYFARCTIETDEPTRFLVKKAFTVVAPPELRQLIPPAEEPISRSDMATFGSCCCRGKIKADLTLPKRAYAPGEAVIATLSVDNHKPNKHATEQMEVRLVDRVKRVDDMAISMNTNAVESTISPDVNLPATSAANEGLEQNGVATNNSKEQSKKDAKKEKMAAKKRIVKKYHKSNAPPISTPKSTKHAEAQHRVLFKRKLEKEDIVTSKESNTQSLFLMTIPPVPTSVLPDSAEADINDQLTSLTSAVAADERLSKLLESPSTATFRLRRQPFLRIEYALQVSVGSQLLIEVPIDVYPIQIYANDIGFRPFAAGAQTITEADEADSQSFRGPFTFAPLYPTYLTTPAPAHVHQSSVVVDNAENIAATAEAAALEKHLINANYDSPSPQITTTVKETIVELPDGSQLIEHKKQQITITEYTTTSPSWDDEETQQTGNQAASTMEITHSKTTEDVKEEKEDSVNKHADVSAIKNHEAHAENNKLNGSDAHERNSTEIQMENSSQKQQEATRDAEVNGADEQAPSKARRHSQNENGVHEQKSNGVMEERNEIQQSNGTDEVVEQLENWMKISEHTETEQEELPNGHVLHTTTTTRTTLNNKENGNAEEPKFVETTVEKVEYDENGVEVRVQKSTVSSEQQRLHEQLEDEIRAE